MHERPTCPVGRLRRQGRKCESAKSRNRTQNLILAPWRTRVPYRYRCPKDRTPELVNGSNVQNVQYPIPIQRCRFPTYVYRLLVTSHRSPRASRVNGGYESSVGMECAFFHLRDLANLEQLLCDLRRKANSKKASPSAFVSTTMTGTSNHFYEHDGPGSGSHKGRLE